jgi:MtN3 and saliva related transmembrane protein
LVSAAEAIGLVAGFFIALGLVPQVLRVWRLKDAREISLAFVLLTIGGTALWLDYGVMLGLVSVILWNGINLILQLSLLAVKLKYGMKDDRVVPLRPSEQASSGQSALESSS